MTQWEEWTKQFRKKLVCTRTTAHYTVKELEQHWQEYSDAISDRGSPEDLFGNPKTLANQYNENFWHGYFTRQLLLVPITATITVFVAIFLGKMALVYGEGSYSAKNNLLASNSFGQIVLCDNQLNNLRHPLVKTRNMRPDDRCNNILSEYSDESIYSYGQEWFKKPTDIGLKSYQSQKYISDCTKGKCEAGDGIAFIDMITIPGTQKHVGYKNIKSYFLVTTLDLSGKLISSNQSVYKEITISEPSYERFAKDYIPWILLTLALRLGVLIIFELIAYAYQKLPFGRIVPNLLKSL